ncbi:MAG: putative adenylate/guanylate cyclase [Limisphaerales bacterium]|nr:MAG: putative adenylate/guanylate cyclase [Limisphaerales bacterium]KAG0510225.1 MAG: putative adenylate/guanylate cyclase [Limisphaerales bacterium]TXT51892.1 MAG: putative adenylate/guanylate cyclase [Limisphaerales bacterium]
MPAATIVFTDIVGFSKQNSADQQRLLNALNAEVRHALGGFLNPPDGSPDLIALPTGDGMALVFLDKPRKLWDGDTLLKLIIRLHQWAFSGKGGAGVLQLRVGVHTGVIEEIRDINDRPNVCGDCINYAQRIMDAASPAQTLFSEAAYRHHIGSDRQISVPLDKKSVKVSLQGPIEAFAKHGLQITVFKLVLATAAKWHTNDDPVAKHLMLVTLTSLPKSITGNFKVSLGTAKQVALIQLTGERLLPKLQNGEVNFSNDLKRLWVFMPAPDLAQNLWLPQSQITDTPITPELVGFQTEAWANYLDLFRRERPGVEIKLGVFSSPLYFGASFLDWDRPKGWIHVSPCVWGKHSTEWPGYDLEWLGSKPSEVYETYVAGLNHLNSMTSNHIARSGSAA